jgi:ribosomal subunit interface protein
MEIVVRGRNVVVPEHFRQFVEEKLGRVERYDQKISRIDVELQHEPNRRQSERCEKVEITCRTRGPVVRAEACADDFYKALDQASVRLERHFRQANDRRHVHHGRHTPVSVAAATGALPTDGAEATTPGAVMLQERDSFAVDADSTGPMLSTQAADAHEHGVPQISGDSEVARIVRVKEHTAEPMTVDQALFEMELVGHDFYLFADAASGLPSVVYRRKGFDYGVIRLSA